MQSLVRIHPVVWEENGNKQTSKQTDRQTNRHTFLFYMYRYGLEVKEGQICKPQKWLNHHFHIINLTIGVLANGHTTFNRMVTTFNGIIYFQLPTFATS